MPVRDVISIDQELCDGCGNCVTACAEGAIAIIDGTARLVSDTYCDGLGACLGHCPQGAITIIQREAPAFDEQAVARHLEARATHEPAALPGPGLNVLSGLSGGGGGCPGSRPRLLEPAAVAAAGADSFSKLRHWPVQLHLVPPTASFFRDADVLLAADCVAFALGDFHHSHLAGRSLAIACPKLDSNQEVYLAKLVVMIDEAEIRSLRVMVMEVPCCGGLVRLVEEALRRARRSLAADCLVVGTGGRILGEYAIAG